jgi:predicted RNA-binding Zn-ribbon protein involved in translation (DUF1610 family)
MKFPKSEVVKFVVKSALRRRTANSQEELVKMVNSELRKVDSQYAITGKRLRSIIVTMPEMKMSVSVRKGVMHQKCPSCGSGLKKAYTMNLKGRKVLDNMKCAKCGYRGHDGKWMPRKYGFRLG